MPRLRTAPALHMIKGDVAARLEDVARRGGSVVTTFLSGRVDEHDNAFLADVPGPLTGVRVDEWDARPPEYVNPVSFTGGPTVEARLLFEQVIPCGADVVGTYGADWYAGTPAVTRNTVGAGDGWYVAAGLDRAGVSWVMRRVLERHGLIGPYADVAGLETAVRVAPDGRRVRFLLNHRPAPVTVTLHCGGTDLLTDDKLAAGSTVDLSPYGVLAMIEDQ